MKVDVAVVGGGISGLATAFELTGRGYGVILLERQVRPGGNAISERFDGFLMEHGPSTASETLPIGIEYSRRLGLDRLRCELGPGVRRRYLVRDGGLVGTSTGPFGLLTSNYLSLQGRMRLAAEPFVRQRESSESDTVADFFGRRFGPEFADRVIDPLVGGLFAGVPQDLSMAATFPRLLDMERRYGSLTAAILVRRLSGRQMPARRLFSWRTGIGTLPSAIAERLGGAVHVGAAVRSIVPSPAGYRLLVGKHESLQAGAVVLATQPHVAAALLDGVDDTGCAAAAAIEAPPLAVAFLGYRRDQVAHPLDGIGYLVPSDQGRAVTGVLFCSTMFAGRAPDGHVALAVYLGGARAPELANLPDADLIALACDDVGDLLGARGTAVVTRLRRWPRGLPQYAPGHGQRRDDLLSISQRRPGLFVTGNYLTGVSVPACLERARQCSLQVDAFLRDRPATGDQHATPKIIHVKGTPKIAR